MKMTQVKETWLRLLSKEQLTMTKLNFYFDSGLRVEKGTFKFWGL